jgi:hypothetical protein
VRAKWAVLTYIAQNEPATSADLVDTLDYATRAGAAATLLRLHRHGHLRRRRRGPGYFYSISAKGRTWLSLFAGRTPGISP